MQAAVEAQQQAIKNGQQVGAIPVMPMTGAYGQQMTQTTNKANQTMANLMSLFSDDR